MANKNIILISVILVFFILPATEARVIELFPSNADSSCNEEFENVANTLQPGDELVLHGGIYTQNCRRAISAKGTLSQPITIRAAAGEFPILTRPANNIDTQNNIEIDSSSYIIIRGIKFKGGSTGVRFINFNHNITLDGLEISDTGNNAIAINSGNADSMMFINNHIHDTGKSSGSTEGEGMYIGCNDNACRVTNSIFANNYIHHLRGTSSGGNDGIEVKVGSYNNIVRDNVIHDTTIGTRYPCIFVYGGGSRVNIVEGNVVWNCGEAIQVQADAIIRNNIIFNSDVGITLSPHAQVANMRNVEIVGNTIYGHSQECMYIRWSSATNMTVANNAIYCPGATAIDASGISGSTIRFRSNYAQGAMTGASIDNSRFFDGGNAAAAFVNPSSMDFWPKAESVLAGKGDAAYATAKDFNGAVRTSLYDVGAYETEGLASNPGWKITGGFKGNTGTPSGDCTTLAGFASPCNNNVPVLTLTNAAVSGSNVSFNVNVNLPSSPVNAIYATGYYFSSTQNQWIQFTMTGTPYPGTDGSTWLTNTASKSLSVPTSAASVGVVYVVVWEYTYVNNNWVPPSCSNAAGCWRLATYQI